MKIVGISGSLRKDSYSYQILEIASQEITKLGCEVELYDLRKLELPFCNGEDEYPQYPDVTKLRKSVKSAAGLILVTPEYHGSCSGVLKNALDLMGFEELSGKVTALISVLGGQSNSNALNDLRIIMRWVHAWVIPEQVAIAQGYKAFSPDGKLLDPKLAERINQLALSLVENTKKLSRIC